MSKIKYIFTVIPAALLFIIPTNPCEFTASLNRLGVNYKIGYSISLAFRYIPDIKRNFNGIKQSQEAREIDMSKDVTSPTRVRNMGVILFLLIFFSMERIVVISNEMELRRSGKNKKRTWYTARSFTRMDYMVIIFIVVFSVISLVFTLYDGSRSAILIYMYLLLYQMEL